jgi:hypothetical protein
MRRNLIILVTFVCAMLAIAGCAQSSQKATPLPPTKTPKPTFTPTPNVSPTPLVLATATKPQAAPAATAAAPATVAPTAIPPTAAPTAAPAAPKLTTSQNVNVRSGPGTNYNRLGELDAGQTFDITGKNPAGDWYQFSYNGQPGWVRQDFVTLSGEAGGVKVAENIPALPPTARPAPPPQPTAVPAPTAVPPPPAPSYPFNLIKGVERCDPNAGNTYFNGFVRSRDNAPLNGVCVHVAFFGPRQTKCSGCGGVGDGVWGFSPFGGPAPRGTTVEIFIVSCDNVPESGQNEGTGFSNLTPISDKWVRTIGDSEQCTGITFVRN